MMMMEEELYFDISPEDEFDGDMEEGSLENEPVTEEEKEKIYNPVVENMYSEIHGAGDNGHDDVEEKNEHRNPGYHPLILHQMQTGGGKTYSTSRIMAKYVSETSDDERKNQFYIADSKAQLPKDELIYGKDENNAFRQAFEEYGLNYDDHVLRLSDNTEYFCYVVNESGHISVKNRFRDVMDQTPETPMKKQFRDKYYRQICWCISRLDTMYRYRIDDTKEIKNELGTKIAGMRHEIVEHISGLTGEDGKKLNAREIADYIFENEQWVFNLYPALCKKRYDTFIMTVQKFYHMANPMSDDNGIGEKSSAFIRNGYLFIDEFDATKKDLLDLIIKDATNDGKNMKPADYFAMFRKMLNFDPFLVRGENDVSPNNVKSYDSRIEEAARNVRGKYDLDYLKECRKNIRPLIDYNAQYKTDETLQEKSDALFLYKDAFETFCLMNGTSDRQSSDDENGQNKRDTVYVMRDKRHKHYVMTKDPDKADSSGNRLYANVYEDSDDPVTLNYLLGKIKMYRYAFMYFALNMVRPYKDLINKIRRHNANLDTDTQTWKEMTDTEAYSTVLRYLLGDTDISKAELNRYKFRSYKAATVDLPGLENSEEEEDNYYQHGFVNFSLENSDDTYTHSRLLYSAIEDTPEKILLYYLKNMTVIGISATAETPTTIDNYNLEYIKSKIGNGNIRHTPEAVLDLLKLQNQEIEKHIVSDQDADDMSMEDDIEKLYCVSVGQNEQSYSKKDINTQIECTNDDIINDLDGMYERLVRDKSPEKEYMLNAVKTLLLHLPKMRDPNHPSKKNMQICFRQWRYTKTFEVICEMLSRGVHAGIFLLQPYADDNQSDENGYTTAAFDWKTLQILACAAVAITSETDPTGKNSDFEAAKDEFDKLKSSRLPDHGDEKAVSLDNTQDHWLLYRAKAKDVKEVLDNIKQNEWEQGRQAFLFLPHATAGKALNLQYKFPAAGVIGDEYINLCPGTEEAELKDSRYKNVNPDGFYIERPTHIIPNINDWHISDKVQEVLRNGCVLNDMYESGDISHKEMFKYEKRLFHKQWKSAGVIDDEDDDADDGDKDFSLYSTDSVGYSYAEKLEQSLGRGTRTFIDRSVSCICLDKKYIDKIAGNPNVMQYLHEKEENGLMPVKTRIVVDTILEDSRQQDQAEKAQKNREETRCNNYLYKMDDEAGKAIDAFIRAVGGQWTEKTKTVWQLMRKICLRFGLSATIKEMESLTDEEKEIVEKYHLFAHYAKRTDKVDGIFQRNTISSQVQIVMKNDAIRRYFQENGYRVPDEMRLEEEGYIMPPSVCQRIYQAVLGEEGCRVIFSLFGYHLEDIDDLDIFEVADWAYAEDKSVLVDAKNMCGWYVKNRMQLKEVLGKTDLKIRGKDNIRKIIFANLILPQGAQDNTHIINGNDTKYIREIPALLDRNGQILNVAEEYVRNAIEE